MYFQLAKYYFILIMAAKELKALIDVGTSLGYSGDELKQFINDERMRMDREKEEKEKLAKEDKERELVSGTRISLLSAELPIFPRLSLHSPNFA